MRHFELDAPPALRERIQGFWYLEREFDKGGSAFEVLPDGSAEIIFYFGTELTLAQENWQQTIPSPFIVGLLGQTVHFYTQEQLKIIGVKCYPWAVYDLLDQLPPQGGSITRLTHPIAALQEQLNTLLGQDKIFAALELVSSWFMEHQSVSTEKAIVAKAGKAIIGGNGTLPVSAVAKAAHATVRTLERKFKASSGHTVKDVSGLIRFEQARDRLWCMPDTGIAGLACELGYADQSHMNREFKRYSGMTAAAFARLIKKRKANLDSDFVAIVLSSRV